MKRLSLLLALAATVSCTDDEGVIDPDNLNLWQNFTDSDGLISNNVNSLYEDSQLALWVGTEAGITRLEEGQFTDFSSINNQIGSVSSITEAGDGTIFVGSPNGFGTFQNESWTFFDELGGLPIGVNTLFTSNDGRVWMGTTQAEIIIFDGTNLSLLTVTECTACNLVFTFFQDSEGIMWFGTDGGLVRYDGTNFFFFNSANGALFDDTVLSIEEDEFGRIWVGTLRGNLVSSIETEGTDISIIDFNLLNGVISSGILAIESLPTGDLWFGANSGGIVTYDGVVMRSNMDADGPGLASIRSMLEDANGDIWVATANDGLWRFIPQ